MTPSRALLALLGASVAVSGCVAAVVPIAASATLGRKALKDRKAAARRHGQSQAQDGVEILPAGSTLPPPTGATPIPPVEAGPPPVPSGMQYLYGSGEAAAASIQAWRGLIRHVADKALARPKDSVVLAADATLAAPKWVSCGKKPPAAVFDIDETVILNLGFEHAVAGGAPYSPERWQDWEKTGGATLVAVPGAAKALEAMRTMGVVVVFNSNRGTANAAETIAALAGAGLGDAKPGETLFLQGDDAEGPRKDGRRATIAAKYCVLAMVGDQLGDFSDLFDASQSPAGRRAETLSTPVNARFGAGWFILPNPVYGSALKGGTDDVFPQDMRWSPSAISRSKE